MIQSLAVSFPQRPTAVLSRSLRRFSLLCAIGILFTSSFDIFLVVNAGGNYRFCQLALCPLILLSLIKVFRGQKIPTLGLSFLVIWFFFQVLFIPSTTFWPKSVGYCLWLLLDTAMLFSFVQLFSENASTLKLLLRYYVYSFAFVAGFGIIQFVLPLLGLPGLLVTEWWIPGVLPRVNGFSYEPSYFASYLIIGFVFVGYLKRRQSTLLTPRTLAGIYYVTAIAIIVSSSRLGIVFLVLDVAISKLPPLVSFLRQIRRGRVIRPHIRPFVFSFVSVAALLVASTGALTLLKNDPVLFFLFLNGTGIGDTAAHSIVERQNSFQQTLAVFAEHPLVGRSLGGLSSAIAEYEGNTIRSFDDAKTTDGMCVFAEVLAASGVIGFIPFLCFVLLTIRKPLLLARSAPPFHSAVLHGLVRSLIFVWAMLQFNQNVLRIYL
ncbi:MAG: hypothetical protein JO061_07055, partial [Acidobacteriaceae bacterium]|nr:hypothetical protein [Acidobacteriaceae bacterium]